MLMVAV